eukprot:gene28713-37705_t
MNRRTKKYCNIDFFEYDEDIDLNETTAEVLHIFSEAAVSVIDSEPIMDHETYYKGEWESDRELYRMYGEALPRHIVQWSHWDNLNTLKDFAFAGILQCYLTGVPSDTPARIPAARFQVDFSNWDRYSVRPNRMPIGYYWPKEKRLIYPADEEFFRMGVLLRSAAHICLTLTDHLFHVHWVISNTIVLATERCLDAQHPIRRLLKPHTYGSAHVNLLGAVTLAPYGGIASRLFGLDKKGWELACFEQMQEFKYESLKEKFIRSNLPSSCMDVLPMYQDGMDLWNTHEEYVEEYLDIFYPSDQNAELAAYWKGVKDFSPGNLYDLGPLNRKNMVNTAEYLRSPYGFPGKLRVGQDQADEQTMLLQNALIALTTGVQPMLVSDWKHIHNYDRINKPEWKQLKESVLTNLEQWQQNLKVWSVSTCLSGRPDPNRLSVD